MCTSRVSYEPFLSHTILQRANLSLSQSFLQAANWRRSRWKTTIKLPFPALATSRSRYLWTCWPWRCPWRASRSRRGGHRTPRGRRREERAQPSAPRACCGLRSPNRRCSPEKLTIVVFSWKLALLELWERVTKSDTKKGQSLCSPSTENQDSDIKSSDLVISGHSGKFLRTNIILANAAF